MIYPATKQTFDNLFTLSWRYAWRALQQVFLPILIFVALKSFFTHLPVIPRILEITLSAAIAAATILFYVISLYRVDGMLRGSLCTWQQAWSKTLQKISTVYLAGLLIVGAFVIIFLLGRWLVLSFFGLREVAAGIAAILLIGIPIVLLLIGNYLLIPLLALYESRLDAAFVQSIYLARRYLLPLLLLYVEMMILFFISSTYTQHSQWLLKHHLMELVDFAAFSLIFPAVLNQTLLLLNNARQK